ncbi:MAG: hypothetical protein AB1782_07540 [Cyanobacteriota bacterium]
MSYIPYQHNYYQPNYYPQANTGVKPKTSVDSVRIDIVNPKASLEPTGAQPATGVYPNYGYFNSGNYPPYPYLHPNNGQNIYNNYNPNINQNVNPPVAQQQVPQPQPAPQPQQPQDQPQNQPQNQPQQPQNQPQNKSEQPKPEEKPKEPEKPKSTGNIPDSLIIAIDKGLSNPNHEVRIKAATKLMSTFEKYPEAKDHPALTVLLNRALKDPHQNVRLFGEIALKAGTANGDQNTQNILTEMTNSKKAYGQDAVMANDILLDVAGKNTGTNLDTVA